MSIVKQIFKTNDFVCTLIQYFQRWLSLMVIPYQILMLIDYRLNTIILPCEVSIQFLKFNTGRFNLYR